MAQFPDDIARDTAQAAHEAARGAHRAALHARRAARRARFRARCEGTPWFFGMLLIGLGLLFLLDNLNIIESRWVFRNLWPLIIVAFGLSRLLFGVSGGERVFGAIATAFGGLWLADRLLDLDINVVGVFWPLILIGLGISMLTRRTRSWNAGPSGPPSSPPTPGVPPIPGNPSIPHAGFTEAQAAPSDTAADTHDVDQSATIRETAVFAGIERRNISQTFRGGTISAMMGSVELDLRDCRMAEASAILDVQVVMGQVVLHIPANWTVEANVAPVLGNLEDRSNRPVDPAPKRLIVAGSVFLGQIEIRN